MHISVIATDFDGTIAQGDQLAPEAGRVLRRWREAGRFTVLASGRPFEFLHDLQEREQAFDLIVAENGAALYDPRTDEMRLPFGEVPEDLLDTLAKVGVPLWRGVAIAGTTTRYDDAIWVVSRELGLAVHVETNRNEVMLLPPGASKGAGLLYLLQSEGLSPRNLLAFGDAENDNGLLQVAEVKVAVADVGDLRALRRHTTCLCLGRDETPPMSLIVQLLAETDLSLVLDLSRVPTPEERVLYTTGLLRRVLEVHRRSGKPHWLLIDEAQDLLGGRDNPARLPLLRGSKAPGMCLVAWQPSRLDRAVCLLSSRNRPAVLNLASG